MTLALFIFILTVGSGMSALLTEAIKTAFEEAKKKISNNMLALIDSIVIGGGGTLICYLYLHIPLTYENIVALVCMMACVWIGSMIGYDKVIQLLEQIKRGGLK